MRGEGRRAPGERREPEQDRGELGEGSGFYPEDNVLIKVFRYRLGSGHGQVSIFMRLVFLKDHSGCSAEIRLGKEGRGGCYKNGSRGVHLGVDAVFQSDSDHYLDLETG